MSQSDKMPASPAETRRDYEVGYGKPPLHTRFKKGHSGHRRARPAVAESLAAVLLEALGKKIVVAENGRRRRVTKREAVIAQLVDKSATADLRATKLLLDILRDIERPANRPAAETPPSEQEFLEQLKERLRRLAKAAQPAEPEPEG